MTKARCEICNRDFKNAEALEMHNKAKHSGTSSEKPDKNTKTKRIRNKVIVFLVMGVIVALDRKSVV